MARKPNYFNKSLDLLKTLHQKYPTQPLGRHISTAFADYGDVWGISDKEFAFALDKYLTQCELGDATPIASDKDVKKIIDDAKNLYFEPDDEFEDEEF